MSHMRTSHLKPKTRVFKPPKVPIKLKCEICQKVFDKHGLFNKHVKRHNQEPSRFMCDYCGQEFVSHNELRKHLSSIHKISKRYVKCTICQEAVPRKRVEDHMRTHTGEKHHQCEICGSQYLTEGLLKAHKKRQHEGLIYQCEICPEQFDQPKKLLHHRRLHSQPMSIHCSFCNLGFFNLRSLAKHEVNKHGQNDEFDNFSDTDNDIGINSDQFGQMIIFD